MAAKGRKKIKVQDLKPKKDAKGGMFLTPGHDKPLNNPGGSNPGGHNPGGNKPLNNPGLNIGGH